MRQSLDIARVNHWCGSEGKIRRHLEAGFHNSLLIGSLFLPTVDLMIKKRLLIATVWSLAYLYGKFQELYAEGLMFYFAGIV